MNPNIFKAYDIRGIYGVDFDENDFYLIAKGVISYIKEALGKNELVLAFGYDARKSTPLLVKALKRAIVDQGVVGVDIGQTTTPSFYFASLNYGYDGGLMVTASHNPKEYNGVKMVLRDGRKIVKVGKGQGMDEIKHIVLNKKFSPDLYGGKVVTNNQVIKDEVDFALKRINLSQVRKFKVVTDTANGMAILYLDEFFKRVSANVIRIFEEIDGDFPNHEANPLKFETLNWIQEKVIEEEADFGMAFDADGDRIFFIDEKGSIIPATVITSLIARRFLKDKKHETIVVDVRYTRNVSIQVKKLGGKIEFTRVGHAFITEKLAEVNGVFAGESSGHFFFRDTGFAESTVLTIALLFEILSLENKKLSQIVKDVYCYYESGEYNFELPENTDKDQLLKKLVDKYSRGEINWLDGISVDFENWRFNIRSSNTEPLIRLNLEAENETLMKEKLDDLFNFILAFGLKPKK